MEVQQGGQGMQCPWGTSGDHRGAQGSVCGHWMGPQAKGRPGIIIKCDVCIDCNLQNLPTRAHTHTYKISLLLTYLYALYPVRQILLFLCPIFTELETEFRERKQLVQGSTASK